MSTTRRQFVAGGCAALAGMTAKGDRKITGAFVNDAFVRGHQIRDRAPVPAAQREERIPLVIVGGGIAGLSAAWRLQKRGFSDFVLLEMNDQAGGNARSGEN
ncbi:MAG: FAD-dependent oxidoreductase, partial [Bryobacteraceae bacterium]